MSGPDVRTPPALMQDMRIEVSDAASAVPSATDEEGFKRIVRIHRSAGGHWFDRDTMAAFDTRVGHCYDARVFAYSNATYDGTSRVYGVAVLRRNGGVVHTSVHGIDHIVEANSVAEDLATYLSVVEERVARERGARRIPGVDPTEG